ncbi:hypothetical protein AQJ23_17385 [Streptomyces antibioticus]|nr:AfsA-related hotdog domain-containing protein [Streptomyces antibioticus]KUN25139.1 hypothetical protein AQJ23_17385 [Streptomyces antibioticus]
MLDGAVREVALSEESFGTLSRVVPAPEREGTDGPLTWDGLGLETMASLLVVSLSRLGDRFFEGLCQWPRTHPLNERDTAVVHHPLIAVESTRQLAVAVQYRHLLLAGDKALEMTSVNLGLSPAGQPVEGGSATHVPVRVVLSDVVRGEGGAVVSFRVTAEFLHRGQPFATCTMTFAALEERPGEATVAVPRPGLLHPVAAAVGAAADPDVLLARGPQGRLEILPRDAAHPVLLPGGPSRLPAPAVLEAGRQAVLLSSGLTGRAVVGLQVALRAPVPSAGAVVEVARDHSGARFAVHVVGEVMATGSVGLLRQ